MAAAPPHFQTPGPGHSGKLSKSRTRSSVKPILKKLHSVQSEKSSLDLDRGWDDQEPSLGYVSTADDSRSAMHASAVRYHHYNAGDLDGLLGAPSVSDAAAADTGAGGRSARDPAFARRPSDLVRHASGGSLAPTVTHSTAGGSVVHQTTSAPSPANGAFSHARSTSGASYVSIATSTSASRNGSFVHPFQQNPQASTPPLLSYATSRASVDTGTRDYSPTIAENDGDDDDDDISARHADGDLEPLTFFNNQSHAAARVSQSPAAASASQPHRHSTGYLRPSATVGQRSCSVTDSAPSPLREGGVPRSAAPRLPGLGSSPAAALNQGRSSDVQLDTSPSLTVVDDGSTPADTASPRSSAVFPSPASPSPASPSPMSPLRHSFDMNHFRLRSRSDVDTANRQEQVREARRKFEEKERAKEEKYAREQVRKRERADNKEAHRHERIQAHSRKSSFTAAGRTSYSEAIRPPTSRRDTGHSRRTVGSSSGPGSPVVEDDTAGHEYGEAESAQAPARANDVQFESTRRTRTAAKRKTTGAWTAFVLWLRTRLLKLGRR